MMEGWTGRGLRGTRRGGRGRRDIGTLLVVTLALIVSVLQQSGKTTAKPETPASENLFCFSSHRKLFTPLEPYFHSHFQ